MNQLAVRDPFTEMRSLARRLFDDPLTRHWLSDWDDSFNGRERGYASIPLNVYEKDQMLVVEAPLPGFSAEEVKVTLERGTLTIRAEHADTSEKQGESDGRTFFVRELARGVVSRSVLIGDAYDPDSISGSLKNGVLSLTIKKAPRAQAKAIPIQSE